MFEQFPPNSRYHGIATKKLTRPGGKTVVFLARRFVPPPERFSVLREYVVAEGDRLDNLAARFLGDPELFWRLADANNTLHPRALEEVGRRLRITLPEGIPTPSTDA